VPFELIKIVCENNIILDYGKLDPPIDAFFYAAPDMRPAICLSDRLLNNRKHYRSVLAHELGHYFTTSSQNILVTYHQYHDALFNDIAEYRANKWAAEHLIPDEKFEEALNSGIIGLWEQADYFMIDERLMEFKRELYHRRQLSRINNYEYTTNKAPYGAFDAYYGFVE
jgi:Zn-dependent peptidase ImmA (M78 family)